MVAGETIKFKGSIQFQLYLNNIITVFWHFYVGVTEETRPPPPGVQISYQTANLSCCSAPQVKVWRFLFLFDFRFFNSFAINLKKKSLSSFFLNAGHFLVSCGYLFYLLIPVILLFRVRLRRRLVIKIICSQSKARRERLRPSAMTMNAPVKFLKDSEAIRSLVSILGFPVTLARHWTEPQIPVVHYPSLM